MQVIVARGKENPPPSRGAASLNSASDIFRLRIEFAAAKLSITFYSGCFLLLLSGFNL